MVSKKVKDILDKYGGKIEGEIKTSAINNISYTSEYVKFKEEMSPELSRYERWCKSLGNIIKLKVSEKDFNRVKKQLDISHLDVEPSQALTLSFMSFFVIFLIGFLLSVAFLFFRGMDLANFPFLFFVLMVLLSIFIFYFMNNYPARLANKWRLKTSSQMVPAILYVVVYMRHTSNLEKAIAFAAENLQPPLSLDLAKVFYDVQVGKFSTIKSSLDNYLESWRDYSPEFIESFHLIESSLFEPNEGRRISILEKSLQVILDGVYDKMLKFTHNVRSPLTNVYMLGVVLPTLALALLPLASAMLGDLIQWYHVFILFNLIIPFLVFYLTENIMLNRPGGYGETQLLERSPLYPKYKSSKPYFIAGLICLPLLLLGFLPFIFNYTPVPAWIGMPNDFLMQDIGLAFLGEGNLFDFRVSDTECIIHNSAGGCSKGPFGVGAVLLSLFIPLSVALFFSYSFKAKTKELILDRQNTKELEDEFGSSLFQLGNRLGNGTPPELVFGKIAESSKGQRTADFFSKVNYNIHNAGMSVEKAIFDSRIGAMINYPSELIATSMRILIESSKKGLNIAAVSLMSISEYLKNIKKINMRLQDMLAEVISDMKSNMTFLAPLLSGVVVSLAAMIAAILSKLQQTLDLGDLTAIGGFGSLLGPGGLFEMTNMIPPYFLQVSVGIYLVEIVFILTGALVTVDAGEDKLKQTNQTGKNLIKGIFLYSIIAAIGTFALYLLASIVLTNL